MCPTIASRTISKASSNVSPPEKAPWQVGDRHPIAAVLILVNNDRISHYRLLLQSHPACLNTLRRVPTGMSLRACGTVTTAPDAWDG